jgi:hypothetical protein
MSGLPIKKSGMGAGGLNGSSGSPQTANPLLGRRLSETLTTMCWDRHLEPMFWGEGQTELTEFIDLQNSGELQGSVWFSISSSCPARIWHRIK